MATYSVEFTRSAKKEFDRVPRRIQEKLLEAIHFLSQNPFSELLKSKKLKGAESLYRVRVGDYRLVYQVQNEVLFIVVIKIGHRAQVYRHL